MMSMLDFVLIFWGMDNFYLIQCVYKQQVFLTKFYFTSFYLKACLASFPCRGVQVLTVLLLTSFPWRINSLFKTRTPVFEQGDFSRKTRHILLYTRATKTHLWKPVTENFSYAISFVCFWETLYWDTKRDLKLFKHSASWFYCYPNFGVNLIISYDLDAFLYCSFS